MYVCVSELFLASRLQIVYRDLRISHFVSFLKELQIIYFLVQ